MPQQILSYVRKEIVKGKWKPGDRLPEPALCKELEISRTPLRDALRVLETEGLVELRPNTGAVISEITLEDIRDKLLILGHLEGLAASTAARLASPAAKSELVALHHRMSLAAAGDDVIEYYEINDHFHVFVVEASGNKNLIRMHATLMHHIHRLRHAANEHEPLDPQTQQEHLAILRAIIEGEPERADQVMRDHIASVTRKIMDSSTVNVLFKSSAKARIAR